MESHKWIASLSWHDIACPLSEFFSKYKVPNLVRIEEGYYGNSNACSFEAGQILMLQTIRMRQRFLGIDSHKRRIAIPAECESSLLVYPFQKYCKYDPVYVCDMPRFYPDVKYFRVKENEQNEGVERHFKLGSTAKIEYIDTENLLVKFEDVREPLPFNCPIKFEALLDYRVFTLESAVREFGLPIKVCFLSKETNVEGPINEYEKWASNLGKVTICQKSQYDVQVLATDLDGDDTAFSESSIKCSVISKDCQLSVFVPKKFLDKDPVYIRMMYDLNKKFFDKYDVKTSYNVNKCQYLDGPAGNARPEVTSFVLEEKATDESESNIYDNDVTNQGTVVTGQYCEFQAPSEQCNYLFIGDDHGTDNVYSGVSDNYELLTLDQSQGRNVPLSPVTIPSNLPTTNSGLRGKARSMDNMLSEADKQNSEKTKPSTLIRGLDVCGEKIARKNNFSSALSRLFLKRGSDVSAATNDLGSNTEMPGETSRIKNDAGIHSQRMIRSSNRSAVHLRPVRDDGFETHDKSKLRKAFSLDSLGEPSREVTDHPDKEDHVYETVTLRRSRPPPPIPFEPLADKRKPNAGRISAENTTTKPDNDTGWIKKTNLKANSANYQNLPEERNLVKAISFHSNSLSEPCREVTDRPDEDDHLYDIVSPKCYKIPPSIPDKPLFFQKLKAGEISAENTTRKPDNDTASIKKTNLKANTANYQNLPEKSNPRKAISFHSNSLSEPCREVTDRPNENDPVYDIVSPKCYKIPPSIPDKPLFRQKLKTGEISTENTTAKPDNDTALIKKTNLGANSANYQNLPEESNTRKAISFHSNSLSEPCREVTDRPNENDPVYDIVSPKSYKIPPSIPDKPLFRQKLKTGEISTENTTAKPDNDTALIKKTNLGANSANYQNLPEESNPRKAISFHSNSLSEPCREVTDRPNENDSVYDIVSPKCDKIPPSIPDKPLFRQTLKAGEISAENTKTKQDNNTALIKKANLEANSAGQQNDSIAGPVREHHFSQEAGDFIPCDQSPGPCPGSPTSAPIPEDLLCLSETGVGTLLRSLNMQCFVNRFQEEQIDGKLLVTLDDTALLCLGLNAFHVAKLRGFIGGWRPNISENET